MKELVRILERNRINRVYKDIWKEIYYEELAHTIMKAEKSHNLPSVSWKLMKADEVVPVQTQRPEDEEH